LKKKDLEAIAASEAATAAEHAKADKLAADAEAAGEAKIESAYDADLAAHAAADAEQAVVDAASDKRIASAEKWAHDWKIK